jgi:hypothetical protein
MKIISDVKLVGKANPQIVPSNVRAKVSAATSQNLEVYRSRLKALKNTPPAPISSPAPQIQGPTQTPAQAPTANPAFDPAQNLIKIKHRGKALESPRVEANYQTFSNTNLDQIYSHIVKVDKEKKVVQKKKTRQRRVRSAVAVTMIATGFLLLLTQFNLPLAFFNPTPQVAGVVSKTDNQNSNSEYDAWINSKVGSNQPPESDYDEDGLTNLEEMAVGSDPANSKSCPGEATDSQNFFNLTNPATCQPLDLNNPDNLKLFSQLTGGAENLQTFLETPAAGDTQADASKNPVPSGDILGLFGVDEYKDVQSISVKELNDQNARNQQKIQYLNTVSRINSYMRKYRSYDTSDRNWPIPVDGAKYLEVSIQYKTPLKYMLAIARAESRFGTDVHTASGALTRPGQHRNIYSMGLTDSGSNITFSTWEAGVESFGKWYRRMDDRGISDCRKWKIYNPNGDYCSKIEGLASEIDLHLKGA